jgi:hypothetical protein
MISIIGKILCHLIFAFRTRKQLRALPWITRVAGEPGSEAASEFVSLIFHNLDLSSSQRVQMAADFILSIRLQSCAHHLAQKMVDQARRYDLQWPW